MTHVSHEVLFAFILMVITTSLMAIHHHLDENISEEDDEDARWYNVICKVLCFTSTNTVNAAHTEEQDTFHF